MSSALFLGQVLLKIFDDYKNIFMYRRLFRTSILLQQAGIQNRVKKIWLPQDLKSNHIMGLFRDSSHHILILPNYGGYFCASCNFFYSLVWFLRWQETFGQYYSISNFKLMLLHLLSDKLLKLRDKSAKIMFWSHDLKAELQINHKNWWN